MTTLLEGIRVVELSEALAGPYCAMLLGDFGADIIKVERPGTGDQSRSWGPPFIGTESAYFLATNRNKRSLTLNYEDAMGLRLLHQLIASADIFICNQPSMESLKRRGLDPVALRAKHPRLIYTSISGYGFSGPKAGRRGYDILAQAEAGVMSFTGEPDGGPMRFPVAIADMTTGMYSAMGILAALYARERTGRGDFLDMALFDSQLTWLANVGSSYLNAAALPHRWGNAHPNIVPYQVFHGSDEQYFVVGIGTQPQWHRLLGLLDAHEDLGNNPLFATNQARIAHREQLISLLQRRFASAPAAEWLARLCDADIPAAPIQSVSEALSDPQTLARSLIVEIEHPTLRVARSIANPVRLSEQPIVYRLPPPLLGEHSRAILLELGLGAAELEAALERPCRSTIA
jgi:crotonobetainyl-CoA:carnitine CoA-transferase CaiB-like acyl-CoA transferase